MTEDKPPGYWGYLYAAGVGIGILTVVAGNAVMAFDQSPTGLARGQALRSIGMLIAILVGVVFLVVKFRSRGRSSTRGSQAATPGTGPSDLLVLTIRVICALSMVFVLSQAVMTFAMFGFGYYRWYSLIVIFFTTAALLVPAILWAMTTVVYRIAAKLDATAAELERIRQQLGELQGPTEPPQG
jgi:Ca2+/Na+ antiporter